VRRKGRSIDDAKALPVAKNTRPRIFGYAAPALLLGLFLSPAYAQQNDKKSFAFRGKVEQVNGTTKRLTVHSEAVEGWMGEMTMGFAVDNDAVFNRVKAGDRITAKVYEGDFTLHDVQVVPTGNAGAAPGATTQGGLRLEDLARADGLGKQPDRGSGAGQHACCGGPRQTGRALPQSYGRLLRR
jgi:Cu/Ag efflux protein CusF